MVHSGASLLTMQGIDKSFGATRALNGVSLDVQSGSVMALLGENGAGKSTLMKILSGAYAPDSGQILISGRPFRPGNPQEARAAGVAMIYQELNLAPDLSVEDNIMLGNETSSWGLLQRKKQRPRILEALRLLGHPELDLSTPVHRLSVAARQLVEIARALVHEARIIVFDEPTSSLTKSDVAHLFTVIRKLRDSGIGIIYISHFLEEIRQVCDSYTVLRDGHVTGSGKLAGTGEAEIVRLMVGRSIDELFPQVPHETGAEIVTVRALSGRRSPKDVSLELRRGEILGIAGLVGSGRTELLRCLMQLDPVASGAVQIAPRPHSDGGNSGNADIFGLVSEDRKGEGLAVSRSIADNVTYGRLGQYGVAGFINLRRRRAAVRDWMSTLSVKARSPEQPVSDLSGGNQQKVAIARVLHQDVDVLLLDEPTRGIDVGTKAEIYRLMGTMAARGKSILFVSSYFTELLAVCDRIGVMARGRLREIRPAAEWTEESLLQSAIGLEESEP
ncbi:MAG: sugar ABC transporter ATP-binding protein [Planctomycetaceae bacterium]